MHYTLNIAIKMMLDISYEIHATFLNSVRRKLLLVLFYLSNDHFTAFSINMFFMNPHLLSFLVLSFHVLLTIFRLARISNSLHLTHDCETKEYVVHVFTFSSLKHFLNH